MKLTTILSIITLILAACSATKKNTPPPEVAATPAPVPPKTFLVSPGTSIYAPGDAELAAVQPEYKDATLEQLKVGYILYTEGACINCHKAKSIYSRGVENWKLTIEKMAPMAKITDTEKDALYKYVMAIKAMQPK